MGMFVTPVAPAVDAAAPAIMAGAAAEAAVTGALRALGSDQETRL
jgi:hypothetical protein